MTRSPAAPAPRPPTATPAVGPPRDAGALLAWLGGRGPLLLAVAAVAAWTAAVAAVNTAQPGDNVEQFVWAGTLAWGYPKHPPLPTWLLITAETLVTPWVGWAYVLAASSFTLTAWCTHGIARRLMGAPVAGLAVLLWGLQQPFSRGAHLYNHNTVMVLAVAVAALCVLRAVAVPPAARGSPGQGRWAWWLGAGLAAAAALLSKYQALVPLAGLAAVALWAQPRQAVRGLALAAAVTALATAPHVAWLLAEDFAPLRYASQHARPMAFAERVGVTAGFLAQQLRMVLPALVLAAFAAWWWRRRGLAAAARRGGAFGPEVVAWWIGLVGLPVLLTAAVGPLFGVRLQNHWGTQALQFAALPLAAWTIAPWVGRANPRAEAPAPSRRLGHALGPVLAVWAVLHAAGMAEKARERWDPPTAEARPDRRLDGQYPARALARAVARDWEALGECPPPVIVGPNFEAGLVAMYWGAGARPQVIDTGAARADRVPSSTGAVFIDPASANLPAGLAHYGRLDAPAAMRGASGTLHWGLRPDAACRPGGAPGHR